MQIERKWCLGIHRLFARKDKVNVKDTPHKKNTHLQGDQGDYCWLGCHPWWDKKAAAEWLIKVTGSNIPVSFSVCVGWHFICVFIYTSEKKRTKGVVAHETNAWAGQILCFWKSFGTSRWRATWPQGKQKKQLTRKKWNCLETRSIYRLIPQKPTFPLCLFLKRHNFISILCRTDIDRI